MSKVSIITAGEAAALVGDSMTVTTKRFRGKRYARGAVESPGTEISGNRLPERLNPFLCGCPGKPGRQRSRPLCARGNDETRDRGPLEHGSAIGPHGAGKQD